MKMAVTLQGKYLCELCSLFCDVLQHRLIVVANYQSTLRNIPEEQKSHLHCGGSLKLCIVCGT
jgi:glycine cleavage system regulatory protein